MLLDWIYRHATGVAVEGRSVCRCRVRFRPSSAMYALPAPAASSTPHVLCAASCKMLLLGGNNSSSCGDLLGIRYGKNLLGGKSLAPHRVCHLFCRQQRVDIDDYRCCKALRGLIIKCRPALKKKSHASNEV